MTMTELVEAYRNSPRPERQRAIRRMLKRQAADLQTDVARSVQIGPNVVIAVRPTREGYAAVDVHQFGELLLGLSHGEMDEHQAIETFARLVGTLL